jgi:SAM-dependent methyltransferase
MRFGRLYRDRVLTPFAEHLVAAAAIEPGRSVVDVLCDGGAATLQATKVIGETGSVTAADYMEDCLAAARAMNRESSVTVAACTPAALPFSDATFDCAVNLLTAGWAEPSLLDEMRRVTKPGGRIALLSCGGANAEHERILLNSIASVTGVSPKYAESLLRQLPASGMQVTQVRDVVRFDGAHQYWDVMVDGRAIFGADDSQERQIRDLVTRKLDPYTAHDGTIRIPVGLTLLTALGSVNVG